MIEIPDLRDHWRSAKGVVCDLWGVVHNGRIAFPEAVATLYALKAEAVYLILLSNSPRPSNTVGQQLLTMGVPADCYDALITSGDLARAFLIGEGEEKVFFHLGPKRDRPTTEGLPNPEADDLRAADYILCTGFFEDWSMDPKSYEALFASGVQSGIPMVCANPDKEVDIGNKRVACAGALASLYELMGGKVQWFGKPYDVAYEACLARMANATGHKPLPSEILAIGDNLETDILGGQRHGMRTLFIAEGLHGHHGTTAKALGPFMKSLDIFPDMVMKRLKW